MSNKRHIDGNGFETYDDCQFFCECVAQYLGSEIDQDGKLHLNPKGIYNVYRPLSEIKKPEFLKTLQAKPVLDDHTIIGNVDGMTSPDKEHSAGVLTDVKVVGNALRGRIDLWSPSLIRKVRNGKKELSLAYACDFIPRKGMFDGQRYDFVQSNLRCGNHLAFVDQARNGHGCRVEDGMFVRDEKITLENPDMDISKLSADEVVEALKGCSDEVRAACKDFLNTPTEAEKKAAEDKAKAEEEAKKKAKEEAAKKAADEAEAKKKADEAKAAEDAKKAEEEKAKACADAVEDYKKAESLAADCKPVFGTISMDGIKTEADVVKHICGLAVTADSAVKIQKIVKDCKPDVAVASLKIGLTTIGAPAKTVVADSATATKKVSFDEYMKSL